MRRQRRARRPAGATASLGPLQRDAKASQRSQGSDLATKGLDLMNTKALLLTAAVAAATLLAAAPTALATFPGHNGRIAFHSETSAGTQIFSVRENGNDLRQLTHLAGDAINADWSPDGRRIAFEIDTPDTADVAVMNADGSGLVTVPGIGLFNGDPSFTPDGRRLVYGFFDGEHGGVASMNLDGTDQRVVRTDDLVEDPNVSPDGRTMSVTCQQDPDVLQALCTLPVAGGRLTPLTPVTAEVGAKSDWAPDGRQLVFTDHADRPNPGDSANVAVVRPDGTQEHLLTHFAGGETNAFAGSYSPDGRWIVFRLEDRGKFGLFRIRPDGTHLRAIMPLSDFAPRFIDWGPRANDDRGPGQSDQN
jgi:Tol biopolymer transport system component